MFGKLEFDTNNYQILEHIWYAPALGDPKFHQVDGCRKSLRRTPSEFHLINFFGSGAFMVSFGPLWGVIWRNLWGCQKRIYRRHLGLRGRHLDGDGAGETIHIS